MLLKMTPCSSDYGLFLRKENPEAVQEATNQNLVEYGLFFETISAQSYSVTWEPGNSEVWAKQSSYHSAVTSITT